jgi:hypothetical protein
MLLTLLLASSLRSCESSAPIPPSSYYTWAVVSNSTQTGQQPMTEVWSIGQLVAVDSSQNVSCRFAIQDLYPTQKPYTSTVVANFTSREELSLVVNQNGAESNCSSSTVSTNLIGYTWWIVPSPDILGLMAFDGYELVDRINTSAWTTAYRSDGQIIMLKWNVAVGSNVPMLYTNQTQFVGANRTTTLTTAFEGFKEFGGGFPSQCFISASDCEDAPKVCVANRAVSPDEVQAALSWVCGQENCTAINPGGDHFYPNILYPHADYAFDEWYQTHRTSPSGCSFNGAAYLVPCNRTKCVMCNASSSATEQQIEQALAWLCSVNGLQDCSAIQPGGSHFYPNTTRESEIDIEST